VKTFGHGADFEDRIAGDGLRAVLGGLAIRNHGTVGCVNRPGHHTDCAFAFVHAVGQQAPKFVGRSIHECG